MKTAVVIAVGLLTATVATEARASWLPSSDELVQMLKPRASGPTRGIRAIGPSVEARSRELSAARSHSVAAHVAPVSAAPAAVPASASASASAEPATGDLAAINLQVQFQTGSDRLTPAATHMLDTLGRALAHADLAAYKFRIEGHTDTVGSREVNEVLSERRANAVTAYISTHYGVDRARLTPVGLGENQLLVPTPEGVSEPRNRRVQIVNIGS